MISDEIDFLRKSGKTDEEIAALVRESSTINITAEEIAEHYVQAEERHPKA
jgi:alkylhydroperoxidase family enzyme